MILSASIIAGTIVAIINATMLFLVPFRSVLRFDS
jgi:hypothetical protein